jgi:hypothetical protein
VKIKGETIERASIREFVTDKVLYEEAHADFSLRFENKGNVHVQPQGDVTIYNMWGKKRGHVPINQKTNFGNVLPDSIRKFRFSWEAKDSYFDIGMYSAVATLAFGEGGRQNISATTYFWVVPIVPVASASISIVVLVYIASLLVKRYIRRALELERLRSGVPHITQSPAPQRSLPPTYTVATLMEPLRQGVIDLRAATHHGAHDEVGIGGAQIAPTSLREFLLQYKLFFLAIALLIGTVVAVNYYLEGVLETDRDFEISEIVSEAVEVQDPAVTDTQ